MSKETLLAIVERMVGPEGRKVFEILLEAGTELSDEEIAQRADLRINDVRRVLYELTRLGFVSYKRISRGEGYWYSYKWYIDLDTLARTLLHRKKSVVKRLEERLEYERSNVFYQCPMDGSRYTFDEAFENYFRCPRCGSELVEVDNSNVVKVLEQLIEKLKKEIEEDEKAFSRRSV